MEEMQSWLALCARAKQLRPAEYADWVFMVGTSGTIAERIIIGEQALQTFLPQIVNIEIMHSATDATPAQLVDMVLDKLNRQVKGRR